MSISKAYCRLRRSWKWLHEVFTVDVVVPSFLNVAGIEAAAASASDQLTPCLLRLAAPTRRQYHDADLQPEDEDDAVNMDDAWGRVSAAAGN